MDRCPDHADASHQSHTRTIVIAILKLACNRSNCCHAAVIMTRIDVNLKTQSELLVMSLTHSHMVS